MTTSDRMNLRTFPELHEAVSDLRGNYQWMYRGQSDAAWPLIPKAGRSEFFRRNERAFFESWKRRAVEYVVATPPNDFEWLSMAQHYGFSTRLLDWTMNPLIGAFFAVENNLDRDGILYAFKAAKIVVRTDMDPFSEAGEIAAEYRPSAFVPRVSRQSARFTFHCPSKLDIVKRSEFGELRSWTISKKYKRKLREELDQYGVNLATIYPDLDGLSRHLNWIASQAVLRNALLEDAKRDISAESNDDP